MGSTRRAMSVVSIVGRRFFEGSWASGMNASAPLATHWCAPAGLLVSSHSKPKRFSKKLLLHRVGVLLQVTSRPLVIVCGPLPLAKLLRQPRPWDSSPAASGSGATWVVGAAPWVLPNE